MNEELEELRKEVARLSAKLEMLKTNVMICMEVTARLRREIEGLKRKARPSLREYIETLRAYKEVETDGPGPG